MRAPRPAAKATWPLTVSEDRASGESGEGRQVCAVGGRAETLSGVPPALAAQGHCPRAVASLGAPRSLPAGSPVLGEAASSVCGHEERGASLRDVTVTQVWGLLGRAVMTSLGDKGQHVAGARSTLERAAKGVRAGVWGPLRAGPRAPHSSVAPPGQGQGQGRPCGATAEHEAQPGRWPQLHLSSLLPGMVGFFNPKGSPQEPTVG